jgi:CheY-specific phosphatase CheX
MAHMHDISSDALAEVIARTSEEALQMLFGIPVTWKFDADDYGHNQSILCVGRLTQDDACGDIVFSFEQPLIEKILEKFSPTIQGEESRVFSNSIAQEIVNIVLGNLKTHLNGRGCHFKMTIPATVQTPPSRQDKPFSIVHLALDEKPAIDVSLYFAPVKHASVN